jgi:transcription-repair coupling factor (superfamily II helicase)
MYEETPDQLKAIQDVKADMQQSRVMDRLVCGDVGFGKTEVAMRAAFKAACDGKQVAVLVPTTVLAYQHYHSFKKRLAELPCRVEYISRMRKTADIKSVLKDLKEGKVDIIIGTHRLTGKDVQFKDLGLLIIDEEQKFGVSVKEKLKQLKLNVDTLTMTATPIPRTLQFSLMGARDMSIIRTAPPNRYPIVTELHRFDDDVIREAIQYEISRNGQVFFIHNRVDTIYEVQVMLNRLLPKVKSVVAHGQMDGAEMERVMHDFIRGDYDVLIATTIIESGLDIPNANTIIINQAQNYGLSDLHQLRGRVGRSNKKAFCYLLTPPLDMVNADARRRLRAIEDFSGLGSGFSIAMQDLDIRGAGNILGAEQSGFIAEIGYETYQRILNEAIQELRLEEFPEMQEADEKRADKRAVSFVTDCIIETDYNVHIPEYYVENTSERIKLYRELDNMRSEDELQKFSAEMVDRFGAIPEPLENMMNIVRARWLCVALGVERLLVRNGKMVLYFVGDGKSAFYKTELFGNIINFVAKQIRTCALNQKGEKLTLNFPNCSSIDTML